MKEESQILADRMAKDSVYDRTEYVGEWNGFDVFDPVFDDDEPHYIGSLSSF